jgi:hypothetical protein
MGNTMTASKLMTDGQIETAVNHLRDAMRKHRSEIGSDAAQQVLGTENLGMMMFSPFRERAEAVSKMIIRKVDKVDRTKLPCEVLAATGRNQYVDRDVVNAMPHGSGEGAEVIFFKTDLSAKDGYISDDDLEKEYALRGLVPADPYSQAAVNQADPAFADKCPNGTHWKDKDGNWCYSAFHLWRDGRSVRVHRRSRRWDVHW